MRSDVCLYPKKGVKQCCVDTGLNCTHFVGNSLLPISTHCVLCRSAVTVLDQPDENNQALWHNSIAYCWRQTSKSHETEVYPCFMA